MTLLEKKITASLNAIASGRETIKDAGLNKLIARLKKTDEAAAEEMQKKYIATVKALSEKK